MVLLLLCIIVLLLWIVPAYAENVNMDIIAEIESNNNPMAISCRGAEYGRGMYQVSEICLIDYCNHHNVIEVDILALYDPDICFQVANWYMNTRIPQMLKHYGFSDTISNRLAAYNWGIGNMTKGLPMPKETKNYIEKYYRLVGAEEGLTMDYLYETEGGV